MANKPLPTPAELRQLLDYDPETGVLTWRERPAALFKPGRRPAAAMAATWNACNAGKAALTSNNGQGYLTGGVFGTVYRAHRVIWAIYHGAWPTGEIDHINGIRSDNRIANLREVSRAQNARNVGKGRANTSGHGGVNWHKRSGKWQARIRTGGKTIFLGDFNNIDEAAATVRAARASMGIFTDRHGQ